MRARTEQGRRVTRERSLVPLERVRPAGAVAVPAAYGRGMTANPIAAPVRIAAALAAEDVMTRRLVTVTPDDSLLAAAELLSRSHFRHLPVVGPAGRCLGVIDDRMLTAAWLAGPFAPPQRRVGEIVPVRVHCVRPGTTVGRIAEIMLAEGTTAVPVVDEHRDLLGLVTDRDVLAAVEAELSAE